VLSYIASPALNASEDEFEAGLAFVNRYPLAPPRTLSAEEQGTIEAGRFSLISPPEFYSNGSLSQNRADGTTLIRASHARDSTIISNLPLYSAARRNAATVYYEIQVVKMGRDGSLALGFCAIPYPPFRLPGWHRARYS
jgi:hypothetical protein